MRAATDGFTAAVTFLCCEPQLLFDRTKGTHAATYPGLIYLLIPMASMSIGRGLDIRGISLRTPNIQLISHSPGLRERYLHS